MKHAFAVSALPLCLAACLPTRPVEPPPGERVADGVHLLPGRFVQGQQPDGNTVLLRGSEGWIVVDTGRHAAHTRRIAQAVGRELRVIVNTHWHLDHVAGNAALRDAHPRADVWASPRIGDALAGFLAQYHRQLGERVAGNPDHPQAQAFREEQARIEAGERLKPTHPVTEDMTVRLAGRRVRLGLETQAVSGGDLWLYDPDSRVLVAGDLVTLPAPLFDTACAPGWRNALARLESVPFTTLVPGHGAPMDRQGFARYRKAFDALLQCAAGDADAAVCRDDWLREAGSLVSEADVPLARSLLDHYLVHALRAPPAQRDRHCRSSA